MALTVEEFYAECENEHKRALRRYEVALEAVAIKGAKSQYLHPVDYSTLETLVSAQSARDIWVTIEANVLNGDWQTSCREMAVECEHKLHHIYGLSRSSSLMSNLMEDSDRAEAAQWVRWFKRVEDVR